MEARIVKSDEWNLVKEIRLAALKDSPEAFSTTFTEAQQRPDSFWQKRTLDGSEGKEEICIIANDGEVKGGMAVGVLDTQNPTRAYLMSMWVAKEYRGTDVATSVLNAITTWAQKMKAKHLFAGVTSHNKRAASFYRKQGFQNYTGEKFEHPAVSGCVVLVKRL